ncbi:hypothetical protein PTUN_a2559 [Pseudoalteromonas tunicata]|nr:hypothetical protein PTUN_a2559 [Pseudoalteromonas tunicata]
MNIPEKKLEKPLFLRGNNKIFSQKKIAQLAKIMTSIKLFPICRFIFHQC